MVAWSATPGSQCKSVPATRRRPRRRPAMWGHRRLRRRRATPVRRPDPWLPRVRPDLGQGLTIPQPIACSAIALYDPASGTYRATASAIRARSTGASRSEVPAASPHPAARETARSRTLCWRRADMRSGMRSALRFVALLVGAMMIVPSALQAADYPDHSVRLIVPFCGRRTNRHNRTHQLASSASTSANNSTSRIRPFPRPATLLERGARRARWLHAARCALELRGQSEPLRQDPLRSRARLRPHQSVLHLAQRVADGQSATPGEERQRTC